MNELLKQSRAVFRSLHGLDTGSGGRASVTSIRFAAARHHRVAGLWADCVDASSLGEEWGRYICGQMVYSARLTAEAGRVAEMLNGAVEDLRLVKGPALSEQAWPRPGLRSFDDLDFRCGKNSLDALIAGLRTLGYHSETVDNLHRENLWHFGWGIGFHHPDGWMVEFNHRMFPPHFPWPERLTRRTPNLWALLDIDQCTIECPVPALHLLLSCVHAVWHGWERLGWIVDIAGLLVLYPGLLQEAGQICGRNRFLRRALSAACGVANRIFGPLPGLSKSAGDSDPLIDQAIALLTSSTPEVSFSLQRQIHHRLMSRRDIVLYTARRLTTPGDSDFKQWSLPPTLRTLYWPLRPVGYLSRRLRPPRHSSQGLD